MGSTEVRAPAVHCATASVSSARQRRCAERGQPAAGSCHIHMPALPSGETSRRTPSRAQPERGPARTPNAKGPALLPAQLPTLFVLYMYDVLSRFRENEFHKKRRSAWSDVRHVSRATT